MPELTLSQIREIAARSEKATPGPWFHRIDTSWNHPDRVIEAQCESEPQCEKTEHRYTVIRDERIDGHVGEARKAEDSPNYEFIAAARLDVPALCETAIAAIAERDCLKTERDLLLSELKEWQDYWGCESPHDTHVSAGILDPKSPWRQLGKEQARANTAENLLAPITAERDRLKAAIETAPHGEECSGWFLALETDDGGDYTVSDHDPSKCDCWKSAVTRG